MMVTNKKKYNLLMEKKQRLEIINHNLDDWAIDDTFYINRFKEILGLLGSNNSLELDNDVLLGEVCSELASVISIYELEISARMKLFYIYTSLDLIINSFKIDQLDKVYSNSKILIKALEKDYDILPKYKIVDIIVKALMLERTYGKDKLLKYVLTNTTFVRDQVSLNIKNKLALNSTKAVVANNPLDSDIVGLAVIDSQFPEYSKLMTDRKNNKDNINSLKRNVNERKEYLRFLRKRKKDTCENFHYAKKTLLSLVGCCVIGTGLACALIMGFFHADYNKIEYHTYTDMHTNEITRKYDFVKEDGYYTRYILSVYTPFEFNKDTNNYERTVSEYSYEPIEGEITLEKIRENFELLDSKVEAHPYLPSDEELGGSPKFILDKIEKLEGQTEYKDELESILSSAVFISSSLVSSVILTAGMLGFCTRNDFLTDWINYKDLKKDEKEIKEFIHKLNEEIRKMNNQQKEYDKYVIPYRKILSIQQVKALEIS